MDASNVAHSTEKATARLANVKLVRDCLTLDGMTPILVADAALRHQIDDADGYEVLRRHLTAERVKEHFGGLVRGDVERYELPNILALNFVLRGGLDGGATVSLRSDHLGKTMYAWLLRMEIDEE